MRLRRSIIGGPGIRRIRRGRGFSYLDDTGGAVTDAATLAATAFVGADPPVDDKVVKRVESSTAAPPG